LTLPRLFTTPIVYTTVTQVIMGCE
jgi:hypothetical protein